METKQHFLSNDKNSLWCSEEWITQRGKRLNTDSELDFTDLGYGHLCYSCLKEKNPLRLNTTEGMVSLWKPKRVTKK